MKVALFWPCGETGRAALQKFTQRGCFVYAYTDTPEEIKVDSSEYEVQHGRMDDPVMMERAVLLADVVVCCIGSRHLGSRKDESTPFYDGLQNVIAVMQKFGKKRIFLTCAACGGESDNRMVRFFTGFLRRFAPHLYRDASKVTQLVRESGLEYTVIRYMNPFLKKSKGGYLLSAAPGDKTCAGVSIENLAECLADCVQKDAYVRQMPVVYNRRQD